MNTRVKPPLFFPLIACLLGAYSQTCLSISFLALALSFICTLLPLCALHYFSVTRFNSLLTVLIFLISGSITCYLQQTECVTLGKRYTNKPIDVRGVITNKQFNNTGRYHELITLRVDRVRKHGYRWYTPTCFYINCYLQDDSPIYVGDTASLQRITLYQSQTPTLSGNQTFNEYLIKEGVLGTLFMKDANRLYVTDHPTTSWTRWLWEKRQTLLQRLEKKLSPNTYRYLSLVFLGNRSDHDSSIRSMFSAWGITHYLARSGLHIALFIGLWGSFIRFLPLPFMCKRFFLLLVCCIYAALSWPSLSFARAFWVFIGMQSGGLLFFQTHFLHLLTLTCLIITLYNPMQIFFLDFQLTFGLTMILSLYARHKLVE